MPSLNSSYISDIQTRDLKEKIQDGRNVVDLDYEGYNRLTDESFIKKGTNAHINRVLLWLASKPDDYVRETFKGGVLYSLLARNINDPNLREWESSIRERFNSEFYGELNLVYVKLNIDKIRKILYVNMIVKDTLTRDSYTIATQAEY